MRSKLSCVLFLVSLCLAAQALDVQVNNQSGNPADLGPVTVAVGTTRLHWPDEWGNLVVSWGTNYADLGVEGAFEVSVMESGLGVKERWAVLEAFSYGLFLAVGHGLASWLLLALARRLHPGRAATPEL